MKLIELLNVIEADCIVQIKQWFELGKYQVLYFNDVYNAINNNELCNYFENEIIDVSHKTQYIEINIKCREVVK